MPTTQPSRLIKQLHRTVLLPVGRRAGLVAGRHDKNHCDGHRSHFGPGRRSHRGSDPSHVPEEAEARDLCAPDRSLSLCRDSGVHHNLVGGTGTGKAGGTRAQKGQPEQRKGTDKIQALLKERRDVLKKAIANMEEGFRSGQEFSLSRMQNVQSMLTKAELELCKTDKERIKVLEDAVAFASKLEKITTAGVEAGITMQVDLSLARADRLEAEIVLEREKARIASRPR